MDRGFSEENSQEGCEGFLSAGSSVIQTVSRNGLSLGTCGGRICKASHSRLFLRRQRLAA